MIYDSAEHTVTADGERLTFTSKELGLPRLFLSAPGVVFTGEKRLTSVWNVEYSRWEAST